MEIRYAILQVEESKLDLIRTSEIVAQAKHVPKAEATALVRASGGILDRDLPSDIASEMESKLNAAGIPVTMVPMELLRSLPEAQYIYNADPVSHALVVYGEAGEGYDLPWEVVSVMSCGHIKETETSYRLRAKRQGGEPSEVDLLDICCPEANLRLRIEREKFRYDYLMGEKAVSSWANFQRFITDILDRAPKVIKDRGVEEVLSSGHIRAARFNSFKQFEDHILWLVVCHQRLKSI